MNQLGRIGVPSSRAKTSPWSWYALGVLHLVQDGLGMDAGRVHNFLRLHLTYDGATTAASAALVASEGPPSIVATAASVPSEIGRHAPAYLGAAREAGGVATVDAHALATATGALFNTAPSVLGEGAGLGASRSVDLPAHRAGRCGP